MISNFKELEHLFEEIDKSLETHVDVYVIGGAMLLYYGMKQATKDIDIVVDKETEFGSMQRILKKIGFTTKIPTLEYAKMDLSQVFAREDFRIDLFHKTVCKGFKLTSAMVKRSKGITNLKRLSVWLCSPEDVFLFKAFTERPGDIDDCVELAKKGLDWQAILAELKSQINQSGKDVWITWIGERLDLLEERRLTIPIMKAVDELRKDYFNKINKIEKNHDATLKK